MWASRYHGKPDIVNSDDIDIYSLVSTIKFQELML